MARVKMEWETIEKGRELWIMLNGGVNKILDMDHKEFSLRKNEVKNDINFYRSFTRTKVKGEDLLE